MESVDFQIVIFQVVDDEKICNNEDDVEEQDKVGEEGVDVEYSYYYNIVGGEVVQVVVDM